MRRKAFLACALSLSAVASAAVRSSNTFAVFDVSSSSLAHTMIAVPVAGYAQDGVVSDSRIDHLVSPAGLTAGDMLLAVTNGVSYAAWSLQPAANGENGAKEWQPISTVQRLDADKRTSVMADNDGTGTIGRGHGLWLVRQDPGAKGAPKGFSLCGIWTESATEVTIHGGTVANPYYTILARPSVSDSLVINELAWPSDKIGAKDTLVVPTDSSAGRVYQWDATKRKWYYGQTSVKNGMISTERVYDLVVPAGTGFWYVRRAAGDISLTFE